MKKKIKLLSIALLIFICSGCEGINKDSMDDITVYTSLYPIQYTTEILYEGNAKVNSMYPAGSNPYEYKFTKKQISDYGQSDLIVYNGLTNEKDYIVDMINKNKNLKIIDATARIEYTYDVDEIWMNPSNVLTIAQNVKSGLKEYITSTYLKKEIDENYEKLKLDLSRLDADIKEDIENAKYKGIVVTSDSFKFLEKYGLSVYSLDDETLTDKTYNDIIKLIESGNIKYIYTPNNIKTDNKYIENIKKAYPSIQIVELNTLNNISDDDKKNGKNYITIMNENRDKIKKELYK